MQSSNALSPARPYCATMLHDVPADIWPRIVKHISLRQGRSISSLACASKLLAQWMRPHLKPARLYRDLDNASRRPAPEPLHACMATLLELSYVNLAHRLELFLGVSAVLQQDSNGEAIAPHVNTLLLSMQSLPQPDQAAALLAIMNNAHAATVCATAPRYIALATRVAALDSSEEQLALAGKLYDLVADGDPDHFSVRVQAFLEMCARLQPAPQARLLCHLLWSIDVHYRQTLYLTSAPRQRDQVLYRNQTMLAGIKACLQSLPMNALNLEDRTRLIGLALGMPAVLSDAMRADEMAISLLRMIPPGENAFYGSMPTSSMRFDGCLERMLLDRFACEPGTSTLRFQRLYQAMAHLPQSRQMGWMRAILIHCAKKAEHGVTPALIVATAQAALALPEAEPRHLYDLFALCLNPGPLRKLNSYPCLQPAAIAPSDYPGYSLRFAANCAGLMHALRDVAPDVAATLLAGINRAYVERRPLEAMLPSPNQLSAKLYGHFLQEALAFLPSLPRAHAAGCLLQWRLPPPYGLDPRNADGRAIVLLTALKDVGRDGGPVSSGQLGIALAAVMQDAVDVEGHSPVRNCRLLAALAELPHAVCAEVLERLLASRYMSLANADVLFASVIEAAARLPDALRANLLAIAADRLRHFPQARSMFLSAPPALLEQREHALDDMHPGLRASDPELYAYIRPGCVTRMQGFALLLDAVETLPAPHQPGLLKKLAASEHFFPFSHGYLSMEEKSQCSMRLVSRIIGLPDDMSAIRAQAFSCWLKHVADQSYDEKARTAIEDALVPLLLALPANDGKPLLDAYLATVSDASAKAALQERAATHWETRS